MVVIFGSGQTVRMRTHPLPAALPLDGHELGVLTVDRRRRSQLLWAKRRARVDAVLTRAQLTAVRLKLLPVAVCLAVQLARLARLGWPKHAKPYFRRQRQSVTLHGAVPVDFHCVPSALLP